MERIKLMLGDNMLSLRELPDNSVDSVVTDPPYGLSFMNKKWDYDVPSVEFWKEVYRVLKPGGHILSFGGTRTYHRMAVNIEDAGFEIRDQIQWIYGSGFPKSHNIGKKLNQYEGWGTQLKPANEPICVARKPLSEKTIAENVLKWGTGGINIDGCRIGFINETDKQSAKPQGKITTGTKENVRFRYTDDTTRIELENKQNEQGRFPANVILDEYAGELLDEQSGERKVGKGSRSGGFQKNYINGEVINRVVNEGYNDKGGASRFFYIPKVSKKEKNTGLDDFEDKLQPAAEFRPNHMVKALDGEDGNPFGRYSPTKNIHPTVKPIKLMEYLIRLVTPPGGTTLDPFMGSGSSGCSAINEGCHFIGMEMDKEYFNIAKARINYYKYIKDGKETL
jgi:site-specific DNA-methyltransferase (adenine-specific)